MNRTPYEERSLIVKWLRSKAEEAKVSASKLRTYGVFDAKLAALCEERHASLNLAAANIEVCEHVVPRGPFDHEPHWYNPRVPKNCKACGQGLYIGNLFVDDGCPCNSPRGVNFTPRYCEFCKADDCVKPGHHFMDLFGFDPYRCK